MREAGHERLRRLQFLLSGAASFSFICLSASAAEPVHVQVDECKDFERESVVRLLRIEMAERLTRDPVEAAVDVAVHCRPDGVAIRVSGADASLERVVLAEEARGQVGARVVALKAVELLREWDDRQVTTVAETVDPEIEAKSEHDFRVLLAAEVLSVNLQAPFYGAEVSFEYIGFRPFYGRFGFSYLASRRSYDEGGASARVLSGRAEFGLRKDVAWFAWGGGLGYRLGDALLQGDASAEEQSIGNVQGLWGGPSGDFFVELNGQEHFLAKLNLEAGVSLHKVSGTISGHPDLALNKPWLSLSLAVGAAW